MAGAVKLVCLDPGHNLKSANRSPDSTYYEWEFAQDVCDKAAAMIKQIPGLRCIKTKEAGTYPTSLAGRVKAAHDAGADLFLSQHSNAYGDGKEWTSPNGFGVYRYLGRNLKLAQIGLKWCQELLPMSNRGIKEADFHVIRETKMPSILFETGFHTNRDDTKKLKSPEFRELAASVLVRTACEFLGVLYVEEENIMSAKQHIVVSGDRMGKIAADNNLTIQQIADFNPHIPDPSKIYAEHGGDVVFLDQPSVFEIEYATLRRELILAKMSSRQAEIDQLKAQLEKAHGKITELEFVNEEMRKAGAKILYEASIFSK